MGVPSFYRWLADKYPKTVANAVEEEAGSSVLANPNGREFDNLYLDMNGIIHPCFHPQHDDHCDNIPVTYDEVFRSIFDYIDRIMNIVRPRKLLYMAIDGVAPRAKMNQQRSRRFRTAKDLQNLEKEEDRRRRQFESEGRVVLPKEESQVSDSNVITPGTEFMYELSKQLQTYICLRIAKNPAWKQLKVILSDANTPGEGEHKIMSFIRLHRTCPGYDPNTTHVLYGLDADLIMLALATHEIHFSILRENVLMQDQQVKHNPSTSFLVGKSDPSVVKSRGWFKQFDLNGSMEANVERMSSLEISDAKIRKSFVKKPYQFLNVWILREYLKLDLKIMDLPEKFTTDFDRILDDFIFICFFAGNDFLPHMPSLGIHEGAIDLLIHVYKKEFKNLGGYLVDMQRVEDRKGGYIKLERVEKFILSVGANEEKIFKKRQELRDRKLRRVLSDIERENEEDDTATLIPSSCYRDATTSCNDSLPHNHDQILENTKMLKEQLKSYTRGVSDVFRNGHVIDKVKLGSPGWKKRYYQYKFSADSDEDMENTRKNLVQKYTEGLCWVLLYYFSGVPSWTWFYPYHYGPFASDMKGLSQTKLAFKKGSPLKPLDQLMAVLPASSAHALPLSYQSLMTDEHSPILDFYPSEFEIDTDGKRFLWQGICKLPFISEDKLLAETKKIEQDLREDEAQRNAENAEQLFVHGSESLALKVMSIYNDAACVKQDYSIKIDTNLSGNINGFVRPKLDCENVDGFNGLWNDPSVLCVLYDQPCFSAHIPRLLEGTIIPETDISEADIIETQLWHDNFYNCPSNSQRWCQNPGPNKNQSFGLRNSPHEGVMSRGRDESIGWRNSPESMEGGGPGGNGWRKSPPTQGVISKGGGSGWSCNGRGKPHDVSGGCQGAGYARTSSNQTQVSSWWNVYGRGGRDRGSGRGFGKPDSRRW